MTESDYIFPLTGDFIPVKGNKTILSTVGKSRILADDARNKIKELIKTNFNKSAMQNYFDYWHMHIDPDIIPDDRHIRNGVER